MTDPICAPPRTLPTDIEMPREDHVPLELGFTGAEMTLDGYGLAAELAGATGLGAAAEMGSLVVTSVVVFGHLATLPHETRTNAALSQAFRLPGEDSIGGPGHRAAWGLALSGADRDPRIVAGVREQLTPSTRGQFDNSLEVARGDRARNPESFGSAAHQYREIMLGYGDGVAAAYGFEPPPGGGPVFDQGRESAIAELASRSESDQVPMRAHASAARDSGIADSVRGRVDRSRHLLDPFYRSGVQYARRHAGEPALREQYERIREQTSVPHGSRRCMVRG